MYYKTLTCFEVVNDVFMKLCFIVICYLRFKIPIINASTLLYHLFFDYYLIRLYAVVHKHLLYHLRLTKVLNKHISILIFVLYFMTVISHLCSKNRLETVVRASTCVMMCSHNIYVCCYNFLGLDSRCVVVTLSRIIFTTIWTTFFLLSSNLSSRNTTRDPWSHSKR